MATVYQITSGIFEICINPTLGDLVPGQTFEEYKFKDHFGTARSR
jgi:hypothetical protein